MTSLSSPRNRCRCVRADDAVSFGGCCRGLRLDVYLLWLVGAVAAWFSTLSHAQCHSLIYELVGLFAWLVGLGVD